MDEITERCCVINSLEGLKSSPDEGPEQPGLTLKLALVPLFGPNDQKKKGKIDTVKSQAWDML